MVSGIGKKPYEERLNFCKLESLEQRRLRYDSVEAYKIISDIHPVESDKFFTFTSTVHDKNTTSQSNDEISIPKCKLEIRKQFFSNRIIEHWNGLPKHVRDSPTLQTFRKGYDEFVSKDQIEESSY